MKYVLINSWCRKGSTGKIVYNFYKYLKDMGHEAYFFHGKEQEQEDENIVRMTSEKEMYIHGALARVTGLQGYFSKNETKKLIQRIESIQPNFVYLFNLHGYYLNEPMLLNYLKESQIKTVYMLFDEYPYMGKCCFAEECTKFMDECNHCPKVKDYPKSLLFDQSKKIFLMKQNVYTDWKYLHFAGVKYIEERASSSELAKNIPYHTFNMGVDIQTIYQPVDYSAVADKFDINCEKKIVLTVGFSSDKRKNIQSFLEVAEMCDENTLFINVGYDQNLMEQPPKNFLPIKYVGDQYEMAQLYSMADIYVSTSSGEAMSNACLEALGCGTPIVGFDASGMSYLAPEPIGRYVEYGNVLKMAEVIKDTSKKTELMRNQCRRYAEENYDNELFMKNLYEVSINYDEVNV